jgi:5,5'-dehydrodivanillate O-demethylase oxygenase subunit
MAAKIEYKDFFDSRPNTIGGRYLRRFWHPVYRCQDLAPGQAIPIKILNEDLTLYRGKSGKPHVVAARCAHRGTKLSAGWVEGDSIRCMYHGWKFSESGQCVEQPPEPNPFCDKVRIKNYPHVEEYLGMVFVYMGEGTPPQLPRYPRFEDPQYAVETELFIRPCNFFLNVENSVDTTHVCFTHRTSRTDQGLELDVPKIRHEETDWGVATYTTWADNNPRRSNFGMPYLSYVAGQIIDPETNFVEMMVIKVPIDNSSHAQFALNKFASKKMSSDEQRRWLERRERERRELTPSHGEMIRRLLEGEVNISELDPKRIDFIALEDDVAQAGQGATWDAWDRMEEHLGACDSGVVLIRRLWRRELEALAEGKPLKNWTWQPEMVPTGFTYG